MSEEKKEVLLQEALQGREKPRRRVASLWKGTRMWMPKDSWVLMPVASGQVYVATRS